MGTKQGGEKTGSELLQDFRNSFFDRPTKTVTNLQELFDGPRTEKERARLLTEMYRNIGVLGRLVEEMLPGEPQGIPGIPGMTSTYLVHPASEGSKGQAEMIRRLKGRAAAGAPYATEPLE